MSLTKVTFSMISGATANILDYGADPNGGANSTAAIQAAIDSGLPVYAPPGTYLSDGVYFPVGYDGKPDGFQFIGTEQTIFQATSGTVVLFKREAVVGNLYHGTIGPFICQPCATGNTTSAIKVSGFQNCTFDNIRGISNGIYGFYALFDVSTDPYQTYFNTFNRPALEDTRGYTKLFHFNNGGLGAGYDSNANTINQPMVFNNTDLVVVIDCNNSYGTVINQPYIEANTGALAINMGNGANVYGGAMEANAGDFAYNSSAVHNSTVIGTYLGTAHNVDFGGVAYGNLWINVQEANLATWTNYADKGNQKVTFTSVANPSAPTAAQTVGTTATSLTTTSSAVVAGYDQFSRKVRIRVRLGFLPADTSNVAIALTAPVGWVICDLSAGVFESSTGISVAFTATYDYVIWFTPRSTNNHNVDYFVELSLV